MAVGLGIVALAWVTCVGVAGEKMGTTEGRERAREARQEDVAEIASFATLTNDLALAGNNAGQIKAALVKWATGREKAAKHKKKGKPSAGLK
jgi:hypothetical protein